MAKYWLKCTISEARGHWAPDVLYAAAAAASDDGDERNASEMESEVDSRRGGSAVAVNCRGSFSIRCKLINRYITVTRPYL